MSIPTDAAPATLGFRMPAEWERHQRTWMGWPQREDNWRDKAGPAQRAFVNVATAISQFEPVTLCANPEQVDNARRLLPAAVAVEALQQDDAWFRDTGPSFVTRGDSLAGVAWDFNGWGGDVIDNCNKDKQVARTILERAKAPCFPAGLVLEGGSIHVDGEGTLLTTEECLLHPNRNLQLSKAQIEEKLKQFTGCSTVVWLPRGLEADEDTNGHVDNFACFAAPGVVLLGWPSVHDPDQLARSQAALDVLEASTDARGRKFQVVKLPLPPPLFYAEHEASGLSQNAGSAVRSAGARLAGSYANFYICNGGVVMPAFGGDAAETDKRAEQVLVETFPDRRVVAIPTARDILLGGGNIHCITQQQPAVPAGH